ncbi:MAG: hypothetical protein U9P79_10065 [Candidatus Cloacimonadota bacterium]|nr:hypothetical protein [Candidatus Cloacimonadota bacterium]
MKRVLLLILIIIFSILSCDKSDEDDSGFIDFIGNFSSALINGLVSNDISSIMQYYSEDYLNNGMNKEDMQTLFSELVSDSVDVETDMVSGENYQFTYRIVTSFADTTIVDFAQEEGNDFIIIGNQN